MKLKTLLFALLFGLSGAAQAATIAVKDANGVTQTVGALPSLGQSTAANSLPFAIASDQLPLPVVFSSTPTVNVGTMPTTPVTGTFWQSTQPVSLASVPSHAVTNAGTFAVQVTSAPTTPVTGTFWQSTQPVSAASLPLPTGAATAANQTSVQAATGSAVPTNAQFMGVNSGGNLTPFIQADSSVPINVATATTTQLVALSAGKKIYITGYDVIAGGTGNITLEYGTGTACATGTTALTGAYPLTAQAGISKGGGQGPVLVVPAGNALCALTSAAVQMSGSVSYTQF